MFTAESNVQCPYCGEEIGIVVDPSEEEQDYIEDCSVCCNPIQFRVSCVEGEVHSVQAERS